MSGAASEEGSELPEIVAAPPGPRSRELGARLAAVESPAFDARREARAKTSGEDHAPIVYARGVGSNLFDVDGNRYVDMVAGFGALALGHASPVIAKAIDAQMRALPLALGDVYASEPKVVLCERLAAMFPEAGARVMLGLSGADAVTAALKTAQLATRKPGVVAFDGSYHGLSHGPLAACGLSEGFRAPFAEQLSAHVKFARYPARDGDLDAALADVASALDRGDVGAVLVEPILGRGGCVVPPDEFLPRLRRLCDASHALLVVDEIWTAWRAGPRFRSIARGVLPDVLCLGKALGGGMPISACIGRARVMEAWGAHGGTTIHTATHFGNPIGCVAALAVLDALEGMVATGTASEWSDVLRDRTLGRGVREVRGEGRMIGVHVEGGASRALAVTRALLRRGWIVLTGGIAGDVLTLTPPLVLSRELWSAFAVALAGALEEVA